MASTPNASQTQQAAQSTAGSKSTKGAASTSATKIGYFVQLGGIVAFAVGVILSAHHIAIGAAYVGGVAAFFVGQKIRTVA